jgi:ribose 5-phosphate isomerase A
MMRFSVLRSTLFAAGLALTATAALAGPYDFLAAPETDLNRVYRLDKATGEIGACQYGLKEGSIGTTICYPPGEGAGAQAPSEYGLVASRHEREGGIFPRRYAHRHDVDLLRPQRRRRLHPAGEMTMAMTPDEANAPPPPRAGAGDARHEARPRHRLHRRPFCRPARRPRRGGAEGHLRADVRTHASAGRGLSIPLTTLDETPALDLTVDGADEVDGALRLIKGGGGALLREKIVAAASARMVAIVDDTKMVARLGKFPLPVEVNAFGLGATRLLVGKVAARHDCEGAVSLRLAGDKPFVTDGGHLILDCAFGAIADPEALSADLFAIPGVVEHGLFLGLAGAAIVAGSSGISIRGEIG